MSKKKPVTPEVVEQDRHMKEAAAHVAVAKATFDEKRYAYDDRFKPAKDSKFEEVHTIPEMIQCLEANPKVEASGTFLAADGRGNYVYKRATSRAQILEAVKQGNRARRFREVDTFAGSDYSGGAMTNAGLVGDDFVPLLGGPYNKQPYLTDYLRAHSYCFHEYNHHPFARAIVHITRNFVLGRGYRVDCDDQVALAKWRAFEQVNQLEDRIEQLVKEGSIYGENMIWWLPNSAVNIAYQVRPGQEPQRGLIPRIRFIDPSTCWDIITYPEDIERVLFYWLVFPTQYQIKTTNDAGQPVPTSKFINQQLPAGDVMHFKFNCVSNEKRGRSDLFPVLGYLKWLRDCVNYKLIALKKQAAWTEDFEVQGSQTDVDAIAAAMNALGDFEPAGSRFYHTDKVKRQYMANQHGSNGDDPTLEWGINMIAAGSGIPVQYFGLSQQHGATRAGALVGTEPVAKMFERRQLEVKRIIMALWRRFQDTYGVKGAECDIIMPEIISQDSAQKLKNIKFAEDCGYISHRKAAPMAAKELDDDTYDYEEEQMQIAQEKGHTDKTLVAPLTAPALKAGTGATAAGPAQPAPSAPASPRTGGLTGNEKHAISVRKGT